MVTEAVSYKIYIKKNLTFCRGKKIMFLNALILKNENVIISLITLTLSQLEVQLLIVSDFLTFKSQATAQL